jgi:hypothetical protein
LAWLWRAVRHLAATSRARPAVVLGMSILVPGGVFLVSYSMSPTYRASAELVFNLPALEQDLVRVLELPPVPLPSASATVLPDTITAAEPGARSTIEKQVAKRVPGISADEVREAVEVGRIRAEVGSVPRATAPGSPPIEVPASGSLLIEVQTGEARAAAAVANAYAQEYVDFRSRTFETLVRDHAAAQDADVPVRAVRELEVLRAVAPDSVSIFRRATVPSEASSPRLVRSTLVAAVLGIWLGLGGALSIERRNSVRT